MREIVFDTETTGLKYQDGHRLVEIGCVELMDGLPTDNVYHILINPERDMPKEAFDVHGLSTERLSAEQPFRAIYKDFLDFIGPETPLVAHNARFDMGFINGELQSVGENPLSFGRVVDTLTLAKGKYPGAPATLDALCKRFKIDASKRIKHSALLDAQLLAKVYLELSGGRQNTLLLPTVQRRNQAIQGSVQEKGAFSRPRRYYQVSAEEKRLHQEFLRKIKNPLWLP